MVDEKCPQCGALSDRGSRRIVQDSCGHNKCRVCLLNDDSSCRQCQPPVMSSVIVYDGHSARKEPPTHAVTKEGKRDVSARPKTLPQHIQASSDSPKIYKCTLCDKVLKGRSQISYHSYCNREKPYKCAECGKTFVSRTHYEEHQSKHSGVRPHSCSVCGAAFALVSKLNRHMKTHASDRPHVCEECGKGFLTRDALSDHRLTHSGERPHSCAVCKARFSNSSNLRRHVLTHSREKSIMCEDCGMRFKRRWDLKVHRKRHDRERPHACPSCGRSFAVPKDLRRHQTKHLDEKSLSCPLCKTRFRRKDNLDRHLKNTHPEETKTAAVAPVSVVVQPKTLPPAAPPVERSNAVTVIKSRPPINAPLKLAFKTDAFKNSYNISDRELPQIQTENIYQKILSPEVTTVTSKPVSTIVNTATVMSNLLSVPSKPVADSLNVALARSLKFKLPVPLPRSPVIVHNQRHNHVSDGSEMHWRRRTLQNLQAQALNSNSPTV